MNTKIYPLHSSLVNSLRTTDALILAMRITRHISFALDVSHTQVEILVGLASQKTAMSFEDVCDVIPHLTKDRVKRLIKGLIKKKTITANHCDNDHGFKYTIMPRVAEFIASVNKDMVVSK